jgi:hypothetical protein
MESAPAKMVRGSVFAGDNGGTTAKRGANAFSFARNAIHWVMAPVVDTSALGYFASFLECVRCVRFAPLKRALMRVRPNCISTTGIVKAFAPCGPPRATKTDVASPPQASGGRHDNGKR